MLPFVLVAMALLSAGLLGQMVRLPGACRIARIGALVAMIAGPLWGLGPWNLPIGIAALVGIVLLAIGAWRVEANGGRRGRRGRLGSALGGVAIVAWALLAGDGRSMGAWI